MWWQIKLITTDNAATCGNGLRETGENCDDGFDDGSHGCNSNCTTGAATGFTCTGGSASAADVCTHNLGTYAQN